MNEFSLLWIAVYKILLCLMVGILYSAGGLDINGKGHKWLRRYLASFILMAGICVWGLVAHTFSFWWLLSYPFLIGAYSLPYGANQTGKKVGMRLLCAIAITCAFIPVVYVTGKATWIIFILQGIIGIGTSVILGVWNPLPSAIEMFLIGLLTCILVPFYV